MSNVNELDNYRAGGRFHLEVPENHQLPQDPLAAQVILEYAMCASHVASYIAYNILNKDLDSSLWEVFEENHFSFECAEFSVGESEITYVVHYIDNQGIRQSWVDTENYRELLGTILDTEVLFTRLDDSQARGYIKGLALSILVSDYCPDAKMYSGYIYR